MQLYDYCSKDQSVKNVIRTYGSIRESAAGEGDDFITGCLLD